MATTEVPTILPGTPLERHLAISAQAELLRESGFQPGESFCCGICGSKSFEPAIHSLFKCSGCTVIFVSPSVFSRQSQKPVWDEDTTG